MARIELHGGLDTVTSDAKDKLIAPKISLLTAAVLPNLSERRVPLLYAFIFNPELALSLSNSHRQLIFNVIRKADDATEEYRRAAASLMDFVTGRGRTLSHYFSAVRCFEHCLAHVYEAVCCMNRIAAALGGVRQFDGGDGSILDRVQMIHSRIKHMDLFFRRSLSSDKNSFALLARKRDAVAAEPGGHDPEIANVPMWLTNDGLECADASVTYIELSQEIGQLCDEARNLANLLPHRRRAGAKGVSR